MTRERLNELMDEYYGTEEEDGFLYEDHYELAEWARDAVPDLFNVVSILLDKLEAK